MSGVGGRANGAPRLQVSAGGAPVAIHRRPIRIHHLVARPDHLPARWRLAKLLRLHLCVDRLAHHPHTIRQPLPDLPRLAYLHPNTSYIVYF